MTSPKTSPHMKKSNSEYNNSIRQTSTASVHSKPTSSITTQ